MQKNSDDNLKAMTEKLFEASAEMEALANLVEERRVGESASAVRTNWGLSLILRRFAVRMKHISEKIEKHSFESRIKSLGN